MVSNTWHVYLLECCDGSLYTGVTTDVEKRMAAHASGKGSKYVAAKKFSKILASKPIGSKSEAYKEEYAIKQLAPEEKRRWFGIKKA